MKYIIPEIGELDIRTIILDLNGTLAIDGVVVDDVHQRLKRLKEMGFKIILFSGDTRGNARIFPFSCRSCL